MKKSFLFYLLLFILSSCISTNQTFFSDPNYLSSDEFSTVEKINNAYPEEIINNEDSIEGNEVEYYSTDNYYDFSYSSRIRRFHRPMIHNYGYYSGFYTDYYWYNSDPFYWGSSIYSGYGWYSPYYSFSPYYNYYSPFYYDYHSWNHHGHHGYHGYNYNPYSNYYNTLDANNYSYGPRGSLNTKNTKNYIKNNPNNRTYSISGINTNSKAYNPNKSSLIKSTNKRHINKEETKNNVKTQVKTNTHKNSNYSKEKTYKSKSNFKSNNRSNFKSSGSGSRSSGNKGRSPKQRK
jgi:hypothetical protein